MAGENPWTRLQERAGEIRPPAALVREQAALLTAETKGAVVGEIETEAGWTGDVIVTLKARVPALDNYTVALLRVQYDPREMYPASVGSGWNQSVLTECTTQQGLESEIVRQLTGDEIQRTVASLFAQSTEGDKGHG
jgi:hypothetical protein